MPVVLADIAIPFQATASGTAVAFWLFLLALYVAVVLIALWVYQDARVCGVNGVFWFALVFFVPVFGLVAYVIFRRERPLLTSPPLISAIIQRRRDTISY